MTMIRVTDVIGYLTEPELLNWYLTKGKTACKKIQEDSLRIGTVVDLLIRQDIKGEGYLIPNGELAIANCMTAWEKFKIVYPAYVSSIKSIQTEISDGEIVGHPDIVLDDSIDDIKTSRAISPRHWTQVSKYARMAGKHSVGIIRLDKETAEFEYKKFGQDVIDYENQVFDAYLTAYRHNSKIREIIRLQLEKEVLGI